MPTYEYLCDECGHRFEKFQRMSEEPLKVCPECGQKVSRLFGTGAGILFKGGGFHQTDYRSKSYQEAAKKDSPSTGSEQKNDSSTKGSSSESTNTKKTD